MIAFITVNFSCIIGQEKVHQRLLIARNLSVVTYCTSWSTLLRSSNVLLLGNNDQSYKSVKGKSCVAN